MSKQPMTSELSRQMLIFHRLYNEKISKRFRATHTDTISQTEFLLMSIVIECGQIAMSDLCERAMMLKQQVTKTVNQLEEKGLVVRERGETNRRTVHVRATEAAHALQREVVTAVHQELTRIFGQLDEKAVEESLGAIQTINRILEQFPVGKS